MVEEVLSPQSPDDDVMVTVGPVLSNENFETKTSVSLMLNSSPSSYAPEVTGKSVESVSPVTYTLSEESMAMALIVEDPAVAPKYVDSDRLVRSEENFETKASAPPL